MLDTQIFFFLNDFAGQSPFLDSVIVFFASYLAYILVAAFVAFLFFSAYTKREKWEILAVTVISAGIARGFITEVIRYFYHRPRPFTELGIHPLFTDSAWSFPSGHATFFFAMATAIYLYNRKWGMWFFAGTVLVTLARVAAGVHYPSDILGGAIIGVFTGYFTYRAVRSYLARKTN